MSIGSGVGGMASAIQGMIQGQGRNYRGKQARAGEKGQGYFDQAFEQYKSRLDPQSPLYRSTAAAARLPLERAVSAGLLNNIAMQTRQRARQLTAGGRSERQDEALYLAGQEGFRKAAEAADLIAYNRLGAQGDDLMRLAQGQLGMGDYWRGQMQQSMAAQQMSNAQLGALVGGGVDLAALGLGAAGVFPGGGAFSANPSQANMMLAGTGQGMDMQTMLLLASMAR